MKGLHLQMVHYNYFFRARMSNSSGPVDWMNGAGPVQWLDQGHGPLSPDTRSIAKRIHFSWSGIVHVQHLCRVFQEVHHSCTVCVSVGVGGVGTIISTGPGLGGTSPTHEVGCGP